MVMCCTCISLYTMVISMQLALTFDSSRKIVSSNVSDICDNRSASLEGTLTVERAYLTNNAVPLITPLRVSTYL
ncbi:hypothetical protein HETIRDRAFT_162925 [Heterobasidion irregulare TC 32-1]|uniref:Secreted protein n=1 Tax=Heterobasidion irregulare (strain TC 32-1) TaxID=747525 RepID=W4JST8_HETIT|nr:uncharacterized protein HETIRDRAFT_162925 [Heterobasidion irregulare TC 32-1]ETW76170.1 hypothetical protein HETIRDRAFT_162925 [Heterobasidion irregulare TC 32-1]